jgi:polysaccharide export outer membrane protein
LQDKTWSKGFMKTLKFFSMLMTVIFLLNFSASQIFAQGAETGKSVEKNGSAAEKSITQTESEKSVDLTAQKNTNQIDNQNPYKDTVSERFPIGFQDTLEITVSKHPELSQIVAVNSDGTIFMPRIDQPILAACKTELQLKENITELYKSYLRNPFVNVRIADQKSQRFAVIGAVDKPGTFYSNHQIRLLELLSLAGGPDIEKAGAIIQVARTGNSGGCVEKVETENGKDDGAYLTFNRKDVGMGKQNPLMQPGDVVAVLEADQAYVVGSVVKPTKVSLKEPVTLTQAIAMAEGLEATAKTDKVVIQRQESGSSAKTKLVFSLKDISQKKVPDPLLQANDIVEVAADNIKKARNGLLKALSGGLVNVPFLFP